MTPSRSIKGPKRFYEYADVASKDGGFAVHLDGKAVHTPSHGELVVASKALAEKIAAEWAAQREIIDPATMPMTKRANTALDHVRGREKDVAADIVSYAKSDLLCYRASSPQGLVRMQCSHWDPVLDWARDSLGAPFDVQTGISHVAQRQSSLSKVADAVSQYGFYALTPLHAMTTLTGSALLVLAYALGHLDAAGVWAAAYVDEDWQFSQWGEDAEAAVRRAIRRTEFDADCAFFGLVNG